MSARLRHTLGMVSISYGETYQTKLTPSVGSPIQPDVTHKLSGHIALKASDWPTGIRSLKRCHVES
jgi:hypothetical protein